MDAWIGLVGALIGGGVALLGQFALRHAEKHDSRADQLVELCAEVLARAEDYRSRVWEERALQQEGSVAAWNLGEYRLAESRLMIRSHDPAVLAGLERLRKTGKVLGGLLRTKEIDADSVQLAWDEYKIAIADFAMIARNNVGTLVHERRGRRVRR